MEYKYQKHQVGSTTYPTSNSATSYRFMDSGQTNAVLIIDTLNNIVLANKFQGDGSLLTNLPISSGVSYSQFQTYTGTTAPNTYSTILTFNTYTGTTVPLLIQGVNNDLTAHTSLTGASNPHQISFNNLLSTGHTHDESYVKLNGNSNIIGNINVQGNVYISGSASTIFSQNLTVKDNIIILNSGETSSGVTLGYSGIFIDRGVYQKAGLIWNENSDKWEAGLSGSTTEISLLGHNHDSLYYTKSESNTNFLSANTTLSYFSGVSLTTYNTFTGTTVPTTYETIENFNTFTGTTLPQNYYTKLESNINFLSANTFESGINTNGINNTGNITASTYYGDGSNLTGLYYNLNDLTDVSLNTTISGNTIIYSGGSWINANYSWEYIFNTPSTLNGYGIVDCYNSAQTNVNFVSSLTYNYYTGTTVPLLIQGVNNNLTAHTSLTGSSNAHQLSFFDLISTAHTNTWLDIDNRFIYTNLSSNTIIDIFSKDLADGCKWIYTIKNGVNVEAGSIIGVWDNDSSATTYTQYSTDSLGNTNDVTFDMDIFNNDVRLILNIISGSWNIKLRRLSI